MTVTAIRLPNGDDLSANLATCEGCGSTMDEHSCGGAAGGGGSVTYTRRSGPTARIPITAAPTCPHCGGRLHQNGAGIEVNAACLARQYALDSGKMANPFDKIPVYLATIEGLKEIVDWAQALSTPPSYGKMASAAGGAGTYAGMRPKTGRKKKAVAAAAGSKIEDLASEEAEALAEEAPAPVKAKRGRKPKAPKVVAPIVVAEDDEIEDLDEDEVIAEAEEILEEPVAPVVDPQETARAEREERRRRRKELLRSGR